MEFIQEVENFLVSEGYHDLSEKSLLNDKILNEISSRKQGTQLNFHLNHRRETMIVIDINGIPCKMKRINCVAMDIQWNYVSWKKVLFWIYSMKFCLEKD